MWGIDKAREATNREGVCGGQMAGSELAAAQYTGMHRNPVTQYVKLLTFNPLMGCTLFFFFFHRLSRSQHTRNGSGVE